MTTQPHTLPKSSSLISQLTPRRLMVIAGITAAHLVGFAAFGLLFPGLNAQHDFVPQVTGAPSLIVLSPELIDHGDVPVSTYVESSFKMQNVGDEVLFILGDPYIEVVEGCCPPPVIVDVRVLEPGETTTIRTRFTMGPGMGGYHDFRLHLRTNDPVQPVRELTILSNWTS